MLAYRNYFLMTLVFIGIINLGLRAQNAEQPPGAGTEAAPYLIGTVNHLAWLQGKSHGCFFSQTDHIDASETSAWTGGGFDPMKLTAGGNYNGNGFEITNLSIQASSNATGFFSEIAGSDQNGISTGVQNLGLKNLIVSGGDNTGGLVGQIFNANNVLIENCYTTGVIHSSGSAVGGLVGQITDYVTSLSGDASIKCCFSKCEIYPSALTSNHIGGLLGEK